METDASAVARALIVVHQCWHAQRYEVPARLSDEAQRAFAVELSKELCPRCVLEEERHLAAA